MLTKYRKQPAWMVIALLSLVLFGILSNTSHAYYRNRLINVYVDAEQGGVFTDDIDNPHITITIPPDSLTQDAILRVKLKRGFNHVRKNQSIASSAYKVSLRSPRRWYRFWRYYGYRRHIKLNQPMKIEISSDITPEHPQLGEVAVRRRGKWQRMQANFYRSSDDTAVTVTKRTRGLYRVVHRILQAKSGPRVERGRDLYFDETWGDEVFWGDRFKLHEVLNMVTPTQAVGIGVQIDVTKVPQPIVDVLVGEDFSAKQAALDNPAITRALIKADAVIGVRGLFEDNANPDRLTSVGLTCALCHVTVEPMEFQLQENAAATLLPIGVPVLGPPNTKLDAGLLLSFTPFVQNQTPGLIPQYTSWGPGRFDPRFFENNPFNDQVNNPSSIPQHWNYLDLAEQNYSITWPGVLKTKPNNHSLASGPECGIDLVLGINGAWGTENAAIKNIKFGNPLPQEFLDRLEDAEINEPGNELYRQDLLDLEAFMQSIVSPPPKEFDEAKAEIGMALFFGKANCVACHESAEGTGDKGYFTHIVANPPQGLLAIGIKTPGLRGLAYTAPYFHDGSAVTLADVVKRYTSPDISEVPELDSDEQRAVVEYLKSL
jgi:mono/diheme cytochrome c family protein